MSRAESRMSRARLALVVVAAVLVVGALVFFVMRTRHPIAHPPTIMTPPPPPPATPPPAPPPSRDPRADLAVHAVTPHARVILSAPWGAGAGQLGRRADPESLAVGPQALVVDGHGVSVLDSVNRRIARFGASGAPLPPIALDSDAAQDRRAPAIASPSSIACTTSASPCTTPTARRAPRCRSPTPASPIPPPPPASSAITTARSTSSASTAPGCRSPIRRAPLRRAARRCRAAPRATAASSPAPSPIAPAAAPPSRSSLPPPRRRRGRSPSTSGAPLLFIALLDGDAAGRIYIGAHTGREATTPPYAVTDESLTVAALDGNDGHELGRFTLPAAPAREEAFRELYVGDDGTIYWMRRTAAGVVVEAYRIE